MRNGARVPRMLGQIAAQALAVVICAIGGAHAAPLAPAPSAQLDHASLERFFDREILKQQRVHPFAGMAVAVVDKERLLFSKGYGFSDVEARVAVDPAQTLFPIASVTKVFTWVAVMQLVEQGRVRLDTDVNTYLRHGRAPAGFNAPITLLDLMNHTSGFERRQIGENFRDFAAIVPLSEALKQSEPARVRPPGEAASYSNWGPSLAALAVEDVSGLRFEDYADRNIFQPLGMQSTTVQQTLPGRFSGRQSGSYRIRDGRLQRYDAQLSFQGSGAIASSVEDIGLFMRAWLNGGANENGRMLNAETVQLMLQRSFAPDPRMPAMAHGLAEKPPRNGLRLIGHTGGKATFHGDLTLIPERGIGIYVVYNTAGHNEQPSELIESFVDVFLAAPDGRSPNADLQPTSNPVADLTGAYRPTRRNYTRAEAGFIALQKEASIAVRGDNRALQIRTKDKGIRATAVGADLYRDDESGELLRFVRAGQGAQRVYLYLGDPNTSFEKTPWYTTAEFHRKLQSACVIAFVLVALLQAVFFVRTLKAGVVVLSVRLLALGVSVASLAFAGGYAYVLARAKRVADAASRYFPTYPEGASVVLSLSLVILALALLFGAGLAASLPSRRVSLWEKAGLTAFLAVAVAWLWSLDAWNLVGGRL